MTNEFKEGFRDLCISGVNLCLDNNKPFRIVLTNEDNWSLPLPPELLEVQGPLVLDIDGWSLEYSYSIDNTIVLKVAFGDTEYERTVLGKDIFGLLSLEGEPIIFKPFIELPEITNESSIEDNSNTKNEDSTEKSKNAFAKNNKGKFGL